MNRAHSLWKRLGPGFLYAGAAIGVSHLVQSTQAGAKYGFLLVGIVVLANVFKYPAFEFGPRYAIATGQSLVEGYKQIGRWAIILYALLTAATAFTIQAAVTIVTGVLLQNIFGLGISLPWVCLGLMALCSGILLLGKYQLLDNVIKCVVILLTVASLIAFVKALGAPNQKGLPNWEWSGESLLFLIALMGWMPAPIDISVWQSIWTLNKKQKIADLSLKDTLLDFRIGYWGTAMLALVFLSLGALVMYSQGIPLEVKATRFAGQFIGMYTSTLGEWTYPIISVAAFATMFSTTITVLDGGPRAIARLGQSLSSKDKPKSAQQGWYTWAVIGVALGGFVIIWQLSEAMALLIQIATAASFITAPILAYLNHRVVFSKQMPVEAQPSKQVKWLSLAGIGFLGVFGLIFLLNLAGLIRF